jgi:hypothetical protein
MNMKKCPVCQNEINEADYDHVETITINCPRCGYFRVNGTVFTCLENERFAQRQYCIASSLIFENPDKNFMLNSYNYKSFFETKDLPVLEKVDRLLKMYEKKSYEQGLKYTFTASLNEQSQTWCLDESELRQIRRLAIDMQYIQESKIESGACEDYIAPKGWERLSTIQSINPNSNKAFIAMSFDDSLGDCYLEAIKPAIEEAGYIPVRVDSYEHVNKIDDEIVSQILSQIRGSRFLVADLTLERCNVYYEAGFANGLRIPIFYTARDNAILHFDVRQYNCILWSDSDHNKFKIALARRIQAVLGKGKAKF